MKRLLPVLLLACLSLRGLLHAAPGDVDLSFDTALGANGAVSALFVQPDGKVLIGGSFTTIDGTNRNRIARLDAGGALDNSFDPGTGANSSVGFVSQLASSDVMIGGSFTEFNGMPRRWVARLDPSGGLDGGFSLSYPSGDPQYDQTTAWAVQPDGKVLIGGNYLTDPGLSRIIIRLQTNGGYDTSFISPFYGALQFPLVYSITVQPDGKVLIGGEFALFVSGQFVNRIARLNTNGTPDTAFNPGTGADGRVSSIALQADFKVLIGGSFSAVNGTNRNGLARLNANGSLDTSFDPGTGVNGAVYSIVPQPDGRILIGGSFSTVDGTNRNGIARLNADGTLDEGFDPGTGANGGIFFVVSQSDGKVVIGGSFTSVNGIARSRVARLLGDPVALSILETGGSQLVLRWEATAFSLEAAASVIGPFTNVPGATSPYTNGMAEPQQYFRLKAN